MKTEKFDYMLFAGKTKETLKPACAYRYEEDAIEAAKRLQAEKIRNLRCIAVALMSEDNDGINEVIWTNCD